MAFVVSAGSLTSLDRAQLPAPYSIQLGEGLYRHYDEIWRTQPAVRTVVGFLARNIAQLGIQVFRRISDTDRERLTGHPLAQLLANPQPGSKITRYRLIYGWVSDLGIYDSAVMVKVKGETERPAGLVRIPPSKVEPIGDSWLQAEAYRIKGSRGFRDIPAEDVVHSFGYDPTDPRLGTSSIETLRRILAEEHAANTYREQMWRNGARISGYIERPKDAPGWSEAAQKRFAAGWRAQYTGTGPETGGTPVLEDGMKFVQASFTPKDAEYISARKLTREEVAAAYFIPPPMVGILENATFSNIKEQHQNLYQDTLGPWLKMLKEDIELRLLPDLDDSADVYCEFNLDEKMAGSFEEQAAAASTAVGGPWMTVNEQRARRNLPEVDGGDELIVPMNVTVGGQASPRDSAPPPKAACTGHGRRVRFVDVKTRADDHTDAVTATLAKFFERQGNVLASAVGAVTSIAVDAGDIFDRHRWDDELTADLLEVALAVSATAGRAAMADLGLGEDHYDTARTEGWLASHASGVASRINAGTLAMLAAELAVDATAAAVKALFAGFVEHRAAAEATEEVTVISGFAAIEAAKATGKPMVKTWKTRSKDPRRTHASVNGETAAVGDLFSNGARWPGDSLLPASERAGCTCDMEIGPA
jgi:HK97 family phage portal protein